MFDQPRGAQNGRIAFTTISPQLPTSRLVTSIQENMNIEILIRALSF
jgi:hypothetical protein